MAAWSLLHDIAFLYLFLAAETDRSLDPAEESALNWRLQERAPSQTADDIRRVIGEAMEAARVRPPARSVSTIIEALKYSILTDDDRRVILRDLLDIAQADGMLHVNETAFLNAVARVWDLEMPSPPSAT